MKKQWLLYVYSVLVVGIAESALISQLPIEQMKVVSDGLIAHLTLGLLLGLVAKLRVGLIVGVAICSIWIMLFTAKPDLLGGELLNDIWSLGYLTTLILGWLIKKQLSQSQAA